MESEVNYINGQVKTYKTGEVAEILGESPAMIRFYCKEFDEFLNIKTTPGEHRLFTAEDIEKLRYIIYLCKEQNFTVRKAKEFLSTPEGKLMSPIQNLEEKVSYLIEAVSKNIYQNFYEDFTGNFKKLQDEIKKLQEENKELKELYSTSVSKIFELTDQIPKMIETTELYDKKIDKFIEDFRKSQEEKIAEYNKKGFLKRLFGRK